MRSSPPMFVRMCSTTNPRYTRLENGPCYIYSPMPNMPVAAGEPADAQRRVDISCSVAH